MTSTFIDWFVVSRSLLERGALGFDDRQQLVPGFHERLRAFVLQSRGQSIHVDTGLGELRQNLFAIAAVRRHDRTEFAVIRERLQRRLRAWC